jgi:hypothetical protein
MTYSWLRWLCWLHQLTSTTPESGAVLREPG